MNLKQWEHSKEDRMADKAAVNAENKHKHSGKKEHEHVAEHLRHGHLMHMNKKQGATRIRANSYKSED